MRYFGSISFANMGGGGGQNYFQIQTSGSKRINSVIVSATAVFLVRQGPLAWCAPKVTLCEGLGLPECINGPFLGRSMSAG